MKPKTSALLMFVMLFASMLACEVPDSWVEAVRHLPTLTPTPAPLDLYVALDGNDANDCLTPETPCEYLYTALARATPGSTVHIGPGEFSRSGGFGTRFDITLIGAGVDQTTLSNPTGDTLLFAYPARVTIRNMSVTAPGTINRHAIEIRDGVQLTLENCHIHHSYYGLRLLGSGSSATVQNCTFDNNYYAIHNDGDLTLESSTLTANQIALSNLGTAHVTDIPFDRNGTFDTSSLAATPTIVNEMGGQLDLNGGSVSNSQGYGIIVDGGAVMLDGVSVHNNLGIAVWAQQGTLTVRSSVISDNGAYGLAVGGRSGVTPGMTDVSQTAIVRNGSAGVRMDGGEVHLQNVTVSGNTASTSGGGGIWMEGGGSLLLLDSTVTANNGAGIDAPSSLATTITVRRSVVAANTDTECITSSTVTGSWAANPYACNESYTAAALGLGPLTSDSGTLVHPLQSGSPLIDAAGPSALCPATDQRGLHRPAGSTCDIGAYEYGIASEALVFATPDATPGIVQIYADTPTPQPLTFTENTNCRKGPGTRYDVVTSFVKGTTAVVEGRNADNSWWYVQSPQMPQGCWVADTTVEKQGSPEGAPLMTGPNLPDPPEGFDANTACNLDPKHKGYTVNLRWQAVDGATGYRLYRNGRLLASVGGDAVSYKDSAPVGGKGFVYEIEALDADGVSIRTPLSVPACK
jgi:parallel beta-helix repeat protein